MLASLSISQLSTHWYQHAVRSLLSLYSVAPATRTVVMQTLTRASSRRGRELIAAFGQQCRVRQ